MAIKFTPFNRYVGLSDEQIKSFHSLEPNRASRGGSSSTPKSSINTDKTYTGSYEKGGRVGLSNDCELDIKVEAIDCIPSNVSISDYLNVGQTQSSKTLNSVISDSSPDIPEVVTGVAGVLASKSLSDNIDYFTKMASKNYPQGGSYNILKVSYKSPCDLSALSFELDVPNAFFVSPLGVFVDIKQNSLTGAAFDTMVSATPLSFDSSGSVVSNSSVCFLQKDSASSCPASTDWADFCYLLVFVPATVIKGDLARGRTVCLDGSFTASNIKGFKNKFVKTSLDLTNTQLYIGTFGSGPANPEGWFKLFRAQLGSAFNSLLFSYQQTDSLVKQGLNNLDYDQDGQITIGDALSVFRLYRANETGGKLDGYNLPNNVPQHCCSDIDTEIPTKEKINKLNCQADIEIIDVQCYDDLGEHVSSKGGKGYTTTKMVVVEDKSSSSSRQPCDEEELNTSNDYGQGGMIISIALKNTTTVSGYQFDVGFNKFSTATQEMVDVQTRPDLQAKGWQIAHKLCDDRFGYDKVVRVVSFQGLGANHYPKGYDIRDDNMYAQAQQVDSIPPNTQNGLIVAQVVIQNAPKTTCECPRKIYYIVKGLETIKTLNSDQRSNPDLYKVGKEWNGPVVYSNGIWWTANADAGEPYRDASSVPLIQEWSGITIMNKRVVTNQDLYAPQHESYGTMYQGYYSGLLAPIPDSAPDMLSYYRTILSLYTIKALHNGLDIGYNREASAYEYLWQLSAKQLVDYTNVAKTAAGEAELTVDEVRAIISGYLEPKYKGYIDDANLDGKFDVADIVAVYNSARMRYYGPYSYLSTWRTPPTTNWDWAFVNEGAGKNYTFVEKYMHSGDEHNFTDFPNFQKIVPTYCQNMICTSTMSDLCPDICGNMYPETEETLESTSRAFSLIGFGERTDIKPNAGGTLLLTFYKAPPVGSYFKIIGEFDRTFKITDEASVSTGDTLTGGSVAVQISTLSFANVITELETAINDELGLKITALTSSNQNAAFRDLKLTYEFDGEVGNTSVIYSDDFKDCLAVYKNRFTGGSTFLSTLPNTFRGWSEYFFDVYNIKTSDLYKNEVKYDTNGATFIPLELRIASSDKKITEAMSYVSWSWTTLDFCDAYDNVESRNAKVKVLPGDGFTMCEVYDAETGSRLTAISAEEYKNFYSIPSHGKISILSHNFKTVGGVEKYGKSPSLSNSNRYAPITMDGGKLITAKLFVTPEPVWEDGAYIEILDGYNDALSESMSVVSLAAAPMGQAVELVSTKKSTLVVGPKTSEFSQNYAQDSASLLTHSDFTLHAQILDPRTVVIKYNTMKPFRYASFSILAHKGSSEIQSVSAPPATINDTFKGWEFSHHFHENKTNVDGLPRLPSQYASDGYSVVTVSPAGEVSDSGFTSSGVSNPVEFSGMGDLCYIKFKEDICGALPIVGKEYICPPIGTKNVLYPQRRADKTTDETAKDVDNKFPEGSFEDEKYNKKDATFYQETGVINNYSSANNQSGQLKLVTVNETERIHEWYSAPFGATLIPHQFDDNHRPVYNIDDASNYIGDSRYSAYFDQTHGLKNSSTSARALIKWSAYCMVKPEDTSAALARPMTIFELGDLDQSSVMNAPKLTLQLERLSATEFRVLAEVFDGTGGSSSSDTLVFTSTPEAFQGMHMFSWVGNLNTSEHYLYMDGKLVASNDSMSLVPNNPQNDADKQYGVNIGYDGSGGAITNATHESFYGRIGQVLVYGESHDSEQRQKVEAYMSTVYGTQANLPFEHIGYKHSTISNGLTEAGYLSLNKTDNLAATAKTLADKSGYNSLSVQDYGSDRCAAAWVSKHICLDKDSQTLIHKKDGITGHSNITTVQGSLGTP